MKKTIKNTIAGLAIVAGLAVATVAPWWVVWLVAFPAMYAGAIFLIKINSDYVENR